MSEAIYKIRDTFVLKGAGLVVVAVVPDEADAQDLCLRVGDAVELRRADGASAITKVNGFPMVSGPALHSGVPIMFAADVTEDDAPVGTAVRLPV